MIEAYFNSTNKVYNESELKDIRRLKKKRIERRRSLHDDDLDELINDASPD